MSVELRHLRYFLAVAEELHFGRAAAGLNIAQPALSQQIRRLEDELGEMLFRRTTRAVELTAAGVALRPHAVRALAEVSEGSRAAARAARGEIGHLTVGFIETASGALVPAAVRRFRADRPDVGLTLRELGVDAQLEGLRAGTIDLGIVRPPIDATGLIAEPVAEERLLAAIPATHPLASRQRLSAATLMGERLVALSREVVPGLHDQVIAFLAMAEVPAEITQEATSIQAVLGLVAAELGIAVLPESVRSLSRDGVSFVSLAGSPVSVVMTVRRRDDRSPLVDAFLRAARDRPRSG
jgi:DNA-binding transcriptional LysR family regulator